MRYSVLEIRLAGRHKTKPPIPVCQMHLRRQPNRASIAKKSLAMLNTLLQQLRPDPFTPIVRVSDYASNETAVGVRRSPREQSRIRHQPSVFILSHQMVCVFVPSVGILISTGLLDHKDTLTQYHQFIQFVQGQAAIRLTGKANRGV